MNTAWQPSTVVGTRCQRCTAHVSQAFARTFGDDTNRVHGCPNCSTVRERTRGEAARAER